MKSWGRTSANVQFVVFTSASVHSETFNLAMVELHSRIVMAPRLRHCVECPKCRTRYLVSCSPYRNGSLLMPLARGFANEWTLYCSCGSPHVPSRWNSNELRRYAVQTEAFERGYGPPEEVVPLNGKSRLST
jgi:hypothetical protein